MRIYFEKHHGKHGPTIIVGEGKNFFRASTSLLLKLALNGVDVDADSECIYESLAAIASGDRISYRAHRPEAPKKEFTVTRGGLIDRLVKSDEYVHDRKGSEKKPWSTQRWSDKRLLSLDKDYISVAIIELRQHVEELECRTP